MTGLLTYKALGPGAVLNRTRIDGGYSCDVADGYTASDVLTTLLGYQEVAIITLGTVSPSLDQDAIAVEIADGATILEGCKIVRDTVGGYLDVEVDKDLPSTRELNLLDSMGRNDGQQLRTGKNIVGIKRMQDFLSSCNRLYPLGSSSLKLDSTSFTRVNGDITTDVSYAYLALREQYAAYKNWTGEGDACPANVTVEKPTGNWIDPGPFSSHEHDPTFYYDHGWMVNAGRTLADAYDDDTATFIYAGGVTVNPILMGQGTYEFRAYCAGTTTTQLHVMMEFLTSMGAATGGAIIRVQSSGTWETVYSGTVDSSFSGKWFTCSFSSRSVTGVGVTVMNVASAGFLARINDIQLWNPTGWTDDTSNWKQGDDERTLRLPIASYVADVGYVVSYTHAPYLIDLTDITSRRQIRDGKKEIDVTDVDALLAQGRVALADLRESVSIEVELLDLGRVEGQEWEELQLGSTVRLIVGELGVDENRRVTRIVRPDLLNPKKLRADLVRRPRDITDEI